MNLLKETKGRLEYNKKLLNDFQEFLNTNDSKKLSKECLQGLYSDIDKYNRNIKYYEEIIKILEGKDG